MARINGPAKFARKSQMQLMSEDLLHGMQESTSVPVSISLSNVKIPEGAQEVFLVDKFGSYQKTRQAAEDFKPAVEDMLKAEGNPEVKADIAPIWQDDKLIGHAVVAWKSRRGRSRNYLESPVGLESTDYVIEEVPKTKSDIEKYPMPPIEDPYKEMEAQMLTVGYKPDFIKNVVDDKKTSDVHMSYLTELLKAFDESGDEDFDRFKQKYNKAHGVKGDWGPGVSMRREASYKAKFSKKADYDGIHENINGDFTCSYCGNSYSSRHTAAKHAARCEDNAFNDEDTEYTEDDDEEGGQTFDIN